MIDKTALRRAREALEKRAFAPMPPAPPPQPGQPPQGGPPGAPQGGPDVQGMMRMMQDPAVQQQLAQQGIQVTPQGPAQNGQIVPPEQMAQILQGLQGQGGQPPQGPQGPVPPGMPADPSMPAPGLGAPGGDQPMTVGMFMQMLPLIQQQLAPREEPKSTTVTKAELARRIDELEAVISQMAQRLGMGPADMGMSPMDAGMAPMAPPAQPGAGLSPEAAAALAEPPPPMGEGLGPVPPGPPPPTQMAPPQGMPVQASQRPLPSPRAESAAARIQNLIGRLRSAR